MKTKHHPFSGFAVRLSLTAIAVVGALVCGGSGLAAPADSPTNLCLARTHPVAELSEILIRREQWRPSPTIEDRDRWQGLPEPLQVHLVTQGEEALKWWRPAPARRSASSRHWRPTSAGLGG